MKRKTSSVFSTVCLSLFMILVSPIASSEIECLKPEAKLELCRESFENAKSKGIEKFEIQKDENEESDEKDEYYKKAESEYQRAVFYRLFGVIKAYGPMYLTPILVLWAYRNAIGNLPAENRSFWVALTTVSATVTSNYFLSNALREPGDGLFKAMSSILEYGYKRFDSWYTGIERVEPWNAEVAINAAQLRYKEIQATLPAAYRITIDDQFDKLKAQYVDHSLTRVSLLPPKDDGIRKTVKQALKAIERIASLPQISKPVQVNETKLQELVSNYPENVQAKLKSFASAIAYWSNPEQKSANRPFREVLYLQGASGTGKTYFADRFADVFYDKNSTLQGLPVIKISLEDVTDLKDFIGAPGSRFDEQERKVSKLSLALSNLPPEKRFKNAIIVLDEADKFLNSERSAEIRSYLTKEIFNLSTKKLKLHDLGVEVDISGFHFILIGNTPIYDASNAFMDRMTVVKFAAFSEEKRLKIACGEFGKGMSQLSHVQSSDEHLKLLIDGTQKDQVQKPGVRTLLRTVGELIDHLSNPDNNDKTFPFLERLDANAQVYSDPYSLYEMTVQKFERLKDTLSPSLQKTISNHIDKISKGKLLNEALRPNNVEDKKVLETYLQNIATMMSFPSTIRKLFEDEDAIRLRLNQLLKLYPTDVQDRIRDIVELHIANSHKDPSSRSVTKQVVYFWGEPGTGKSYLAEGLAKALNLTLIELDFKGAKFTELFGEGFFDFMFSGPAKLSKFTQTFLNSDGKTPEKNGIIYINEIDKILNNSKAGDSESIKTMLLDILDTDKREFEVRDLRASIDLTRYLFVLVGNEKIVSQSKASALDDRMTFIEFKGFSLESKLEIARKFFASLVKSSNLTVSAGEEAVIDSLMTYSHVDKQQISLRTPFRIIELYANWLVKREGAAFDFKSRLDRE